MVGDRPLDWFAHPTVWLAAAGVAVNDHLLKEVWPGVVTGKVSDLLGMFLVPFVFMAVLTVGVGRMGSLARVRAGLRYRWAVACVLAAAGLAAAKLTATGGEAYGWFVGAVRSAVRLPLALVGDGELHLRPILVAHDPTDVLAVVALVPATVVAHRIVSSRGRRGARRADVGDSLDVEQSRTRLVRDLR